MLLASVVLDIPTQSLDSAYSYAVQDNDMPHIEVGCAVLVPFRNRCAIGYVVELEHIELDDIEAWERKGFKPSSLKTVNEILSPSYFDEWGAACAFFLSETYIAPLSSCIRLFTPPGGTPRLVRIGSNWTVEKPEAQAVSDTWVRLCPSAAVFKPRKNAVKQKAILQALANGELKVSELSLEFGQLSSTLEALVSYGVVERFSRRRVRGQSDFWDGNFVASKKPKLNTCQSEAVFAINQAQQRASGEVVVVDGITGSGKTEVYLRAIEQTLHDGRSAIMLVPEISLTPQTVARFRGRFGDTVAVSHSRMSQGERYDQWDRIKKGEARVVVGARSALFSPLSDIGLIVIDEEHESSYKQSSSPRYVSRDVAAWIVKQRNAVLVLGSATPSIEALYRCEKWDSWHRVVLPHRINGRDLPPVEVVDMARVFNTGNRSMFSLRLSTALKETLDAQQKAVLFLNQRGFAQFLLCRDCGFVPTCPSCSVSLTYHEREGRLKCHYCGYSRPLPSQCPNCKSPYLKKFGAGTQRVEDELRSVLEGYDADIIRMDADTTAKKGAHQKLLEKFGSSEAAILLGTQMIAKGLDFDDVTLVGVINADTMLNLPDFRSAERSFNMIEQVAGRAGRADLPGRVIIQTYQADAAPIRAASMYNRTSFLKDELPKRRLLGYPPYVRLANVLLWGKDEAKVKAKAESLYERLKIQLFEQGGKDWICLPAGPCVISRLRGSYRYHIVVKVPENSDISSVLLPVFKHNKTDQDVNITVDIDPDDLL